MTIPNILGSMKVVVVDHDDLLDVVTRLCETVDARYEVRAHRDCPCDWCPQKDHVAERDILLVVPDVERVTDPTTSALRDLLMRGRGVGVSVLATSTRLDLVPNAVRDLMRRDTDLP